MKDGVPVNPGKGSSSSASQAPPVEVDPFADLENESAPTGTFRSQPMKTTEKTFAPEWGIKLADSVFRSNAVAKEFLTKSVPPRDIAEMVKLPEGSFVHEATKHMARGVAFQSMLLERFEASCRIKDAAESDLIQTKSQLKASEDVVVELQAKMKELSEELKQKKGECCTLETRLDKLQVSSQKEKLELEGKVTELSAKVDGLLLDNTAYGAASMFLGFEQGLLEAGMSPEEAAARPLPQARLQVIQERVEGKAAEFKANFQAMQAPRAEEAEEEDGEEEEAGEDAGEDGAMVEVATEAPPVSRPSDRVD